MYVEPSFKTKKALKDAVKAGQIVTVYQPNNIFGTSPPVNGEVSVEGPSFEAHRWYARVKLENGRVVKVV